jgi:hypothetical protein
MPRWTVRNVSEDAVRAVQELAANSGASLGEVLTACIKLGLDQARARLLASGRGSDPTPRIGGGLDEIFRSIKLLSEGARKARSK